MKICVPNIPTIKKSDEGGLGPVIRGGKGGACSKLRPVGWALIRERTLIKTYALSVCNRIGPRAMED